MDRPVRDCPKCSKENKPIPMERKTVDAGTDLALTPVMKFRFNHTSQVDYCCRCRSYYPAELKGVAL